NEVKNLYHKRVRKGGRLDVEKDMDLATKAIGLAAVVLNLAVALLNYYKTESKKRKRKRKRRKKRKRKLRE
ncbi:MAG: hypothetical protein IJT13_01820, partial [Bacteroidaceae bacterium]|nr:hypothetical protein [Bacteroidaceae bacterium]